jgi:hypothetical protein
LKFTFPPKLITEPLIHQRGHKFEIVTNVRRAEVVEDAGWVVLELEGSEEALTSGIDWIASKGVRVDPVGGSIVEG